MSKKYLIGFDSGTQSAKVVIFDLDGNIICEGKQDLQAMTLPGANMAEHPDDDLWDAIVIASKQAMSSFTNEHKGDVNDILGLGLCVQRCCRVLLHSDGSLAAPVIGWMDKRVNVPYEHLDCYKNVAYVTASSGYITHRLTGQCNDTAANYIGQWPIDNDTWDWSTDADIFKHYNIPRKMLFDLKLPGEALGTITAKAAALTGFPEGLPVIATAHDKAVEALGAFAHDLSKNTVLISLGTYIGAMMLGTKNLQNTTSFWPFLASQPKHYLYESYGVRRGMWTVSWFRNEFGGAVKDMAQQAGLSIDDYFNYEASLINPGCDGLITIHDWAPPADKPYRKGAMLGFDGRHTRAHMFRSVLEGIVFTVKNHVDAMCAELGITLENLVISGGGSNSELAMQIFADVFGVQTFRNKINSAASLGAAIDVAVAVGAYQSFEDAIKHMVKIEDEFTPNPKNTQFYKLFNENVYQGINVHLDPIMLEIHPLVD